MCTTLLDIVRLVCCSVARLKSNLKAIPSMCRSALLPKDRSHTHIGHHPKFGLFTTLPLCNPPSSSPNPLQSPLP